MNVSMMRNQVTAYTQMMIDTQIMFGIPLGTCTVTQSICDQIKLLPSMSQYGVNTSYQDNPDMYNVLKDHSELRRELTSVFSTWINSIQGNNTTWVMTTNWITENSTGKNMGMHNHTNAMYSAVLYFGQYDDNHPQLVLYNPYHMGAQQSMHVASPAVNPFNNASYLAPIGEGIMIMFPSFLYHEHESFESTSNRQSFACNFFPTGVIGQGDSTLDTNWLQYDDKQ